MSSILGKMINLISMISWPFQEVEKVLQEFPDKKEIIFETGYGPSGLPHIGTFGEVFRTTVVANALKKIAPEIKPKLLQFPMIWMVYGKYQIIYQIRKC